MNWIYLVAKSIGLVIASHLVLSGCQASNSSGESGSFEVLMDEIEINDMRTIYLCQGFNMPPLNVHNETYDLIEFETIIRNKNLIHHMLLFVCDEDLEINEKPHLCFSSPTSGQCNEWVAQWSIGMPLANIVDENAGFRIGKGFKKKFYLQVHMESSTTVRAFREEETNKRKVNSLIEHPGFRVTWTKSLRKHVAASVQIGQELIEIPANSNEVRVSGACRPLDCLTNASSLHHQERMIHLTRVYMHMHSLGQRAELIHVSADRTQVKERQQLDVVMANEPDYNYIKPKVHVFGVHRDFEMALGDQLILNCYFSSAKGERQRNETIGWGEGANAEMCYGFVNYYPKLEKFNKCTQNGQENICL